MSEIEFNAEECEIVKEMIPRARTFNSLEAIKAAIDDPKNDAVYALAPEEAHPAGYSFIILKGQNALRNISIGGGSIRDLIIMCRNPGEALYLYEEFGEKNILQ